MFLNKYVQIGKFWCFYKKKNFKIRRDKIDHTLFFPKISMSLDLGKK